MAQKKAKLIDRMPPIPTGNDQKDIQAQHQYLIYLREQMNFILTLLGREREEE